MRGRGGGHDMLGYVPVKPPCFQTPEVGMSAIQQYLVGSGEGGGGGDIKTHRKTLYIEQCNLQYQQINVQHLKSISTTTISTLRQLCKKNTAKCSV